MPQYEYVKPVTDSVYCCLLPLHVTLLLTKLNSNRPLQLRSDTSHTFSHYNLDFYFLSIISTNVELHLQSVSGSEEFLHNTINYKLLLVPVAT
jgi:hypothetical protein